MIRPKQGSLDALFYREYFGYLGRIRKGETVTIEEFLDKYDLRYFMSISLRPDDTIKRVLSPDGKIYEYMISEKDLKYVVKRVR